MSMFKWPTRAVAFSVALLAGCANMQSHDKLHTEVQAAQSAGGPVAALKQLDASATTDDARKALLFNMERGELLRQNKQYKESTDAWLLADAKVNEWENTAKSDPSRLLSYAAASLISERLKPYEGQDYEKVWLTTRLALNRIAMNDWQSARVDIKRTHEREAIIAELRAKETAAAEEEAKTKGVQANTKELNGYPVESLNDPEVLKLKNGYQNALSHYLAGFLYEVLNEGGLASPGYRKAIELRPETPILEEGLRGLDGRTSFTHRRRQKMTDVLFVIETGSAPARKSVSFTIPVPISGKMNTVSVAYPVIAPARQQGPNYITVGGSSIQATTIVDLNVMARRALKDEMPGTLARGVVRAVAKGAVQNEMQKRAGLFGGALAMIASAATEQADDRIWRTLPGAVSIARGYLPIGEQKILIDGRDSGATINVTGQYMLVPIQVIGSSVTLGQAASFGQLEVAETSTNQVATQPAVNTNVVSQDQPANKPASKASIKSNPAKIAPSKP